MKLNPLILLALISNFQISVLAAKRRQQSSQGNSEHTVDYQELNKMGERMCNKSVEVVEEKVKSVTTQISLNQVLCETQIKAIRDSEEMNNQMCDFRMKLANQQCILNGTISSISKNGRTVSGRVARKLMPLFPGSKYYISKEKMSWHLAGKFCKSNGMELASIETEAENNALLDAIDDENSKEFYWLSGSDLGSEGTFYWAGTGLDVSGFTYFAEGQPDNRGGKEHCLQFWRFSSATLAWNDHQCQLNFRFICEVNENVL
ncbi:C-type lectin domain family 4 member F-like [Cloeon dipterum]|uniref:C-type lectin domain family 4 member F-like n=1 Tax=Cloeon dipterum TaxID=197152 RepID=UPI00321FFBD4